MCIRDKRRKRGIQTARGETERRERRRNNKHSPGKWFFGYCLDVPFFFPFPGFYMIMFFFVWWVVLHVYECLRVRRVPFYHRARRTGGAGARERTAGRIYGGARQITIYIKRHDAGDDHMQRQAALYRPPLTPLLAPLPPPYLYAHPYGTTPHSHIPPRPRAKTTSPLGPLLMTTHALTNNDNDNKLFFFISKKKRSTIHETAYNCRGVYIKQRLNP